MAVLRYFHQPPKATTSTVVVNNTAILTVSAALNNKVDKSAGRGLSQNNYSTPEKNKLKGIQDGAEVNVLSDWNQADVESDAYIQNKPESLPASDVYEWAKQPTKPVYTPTEIGLGNVTNDAQVKRSEMGVANGVATLNQDGLVPATQLPSYVDDVLEYSSVSLFPRPGTDGKIYIDTTTNITYRWSGSDYVEISKSLALGETSSTAYRGDRGKTAYTHATDSSRLTTATSVGLYKVGCTAQGHISGLTAITKADITGLGIPALDTNTTYTFAGGTNKFTVTPSGGTAQDVTVTPSITRNVTGATTWTAANVITTTNAASGNVIKASGVTISTSAPTSSSTDTVVPTSKAVYSAIDSNKYTLPTASASVLGGVKVGTNLSISNGVLSATDTTYSNATEEAAGLMSATDKTTLNGLSILSPVVRANRNIGNTAQWTIFASIDYPSVARYDDIVLLVQGLGYYYSGQNTGCWIVECRTKYNGGTNPNTIGMTATELSPKGSTGTVQFGYYTDATAGKTYFGVYTSTRHHYIETIKLGGQNIEHLKTRIVLTEAPTGWINVDTREYLTETDFSMSYSTDTSGNTTYRLAIGDSVYYIADTDTRYETFKPSGTAAASGLVPKPSTAAGTTKYLREDATWAVPPDTKYTLPTASASTLGGVKVGTNLSISSGVLSATDTTYSAGTLALYNTGTDTANRVWSASVLKSIGNKYLPLAGGTMTGSIIGSDGAHMRVKMQRDTSNAVTGLDWLNTSDETIGTILFHNTANRMIFNSIGAASVYTDAVGKYSFIVGNDELTYNTHKIWHAGNDGSGSGLDADLLDGLHASDLCRKYIYELTAGKTLKITFGNCYQAIVTGRGSNSGGNSIILVGTGYTTDSNYWRALYKGSTVSWCTQSGERGIEIKNTHTEGYLFITVLALRGTVTFAEADDLSGTAVTNVVAMTSQIPTDLEDLTNNAGYVKSSGVTKITAGAGLTGGNITTTGTIALDTSGVTAGTYKRVTVDKYGRVTSGDNSDADTTYSAGTGLSLSGTTFSLALTKALVTTALGYTPPESDTNTHRPILVNGTLILGDNTTALNLKAGSNVSLSNSSGTVTIAATDTTYPSVTLWGQTFNHNNDVNGYIYLTNATRYHRIYAKHGDDARGLISYDSGDTTNLTTGYWRFYEYSPNSTASPESTGSAEIYSLPRPAKGLSESVSYNILTSKDLSFSITGNAATATKLATARTINGTSFDGSANITTANWGTARNISIADSDSTNTGTAVSVNGSAAVTLKLPAIIKATLSGNSSTATKLATARTISLTGDATGSTTFDGSANKSISVSIDDMTGATSSANGAHGLVPQPLKADRFKFLRGDGTWAFPNDTLTVKTSLKNAVTIDASTASIYVLKMSGSITNITVNNAVKGLNIWAICVNSSAATRTVKVVYNMDSTPLYMCYNGTDLSIEVAAGGNRIVSFIYDGTTFYVNWW